MYSINSLSTNEKQEKRACFAQIQLLRFYFATHLIEAFTRQFDELLSWAEIIAMECAFVDDAELAEKYWNSVSNGKAKHTTPYYALPHMEEFSDGLLNRLMLKQKLVIFEKSPFRNTDQLKVDSMFAEARECWVRGENEKAVRRFREYLVEFASQSLQRDIEYSLQLRNLTVEYPEKAILCLRGPLHYDTLPVLLLERKVSFISYLFTQPYIPPFGEVVIGRIIRGENIDDETLTRLHIYQDFLVKAGAIDYKSRLKCGEKALAMTATELREYNPQKETNTRDLPKPRR